MHLESILFRVVYSRSIENRKVHCQHVQNHLIIKTVLQRNTGFVAHAHAAYFFLDTFESFKFYGHCFCIHANLKACRRQSMSCFVIIGVTPLRREPVAKSYSTFLTKFKMRSRYMSLLLNLMRKSRPQDKWWCLFYHYYLKKNASHTSLL